MSYNQQNQNQNQSAPSFILFQEKPLMYDQHTNYGSNDTSQQVYYPNLQQYTNQNQGYNYSSQQVYQNQPTYTTQQGYSTQSYNQSNNNYYTQQQVYSTTQSYNVQSNNSYNVTPNYSTQSYNNQSNNNNYYTQQQVYSTTQSYNQSSQYGTYSYNQSYNINMDQEPILAFSDYIYQIDPFTGKNQIVSKEGGWNGCRLPLYYKGLIYVISNGSGHIFVWNPRDKSFKTLSKDNWAGTRGFVVYKDNFYLICDKIYKMDPTTGQYSQCSKESGWGTIGTGTPYVFNNKVLMTDAMSGNFFAWNPEDGSYSVVASGDWRTTNCFCELNGRLFAFCNAVYEVDISTGKYSQISTGYGSWAGSQNCVVRGGNLLVFHKVVSDKVKYAYIWKFNLNDGSSTKITEDNWVSAASII